MPESRDSGEGLEDVLTLTQQLSNWRPIALAEATSRYARCLPVSYGCRYEEVGSGEVRSTTLLPLPRNQTHTRDSNHERYLPCRWSRTSYLGVPRCPSRLGLRENTVSIRQFFLPAPLAPPAHARVSIPVPPPFELTANRPSGSYVTVCAVPAC